MTLEEVKTYFDFFQEYNKKQKNGRPYSCFKNNYHEDLSIIEKKDKFYTVCNICNHKAKLNETMIAVMKELYLAHKDD